MSSGYLHANYAQAFTEVGQPLFLPAAGGWVLQRAIPNSMSKDAMSCYPLLACRVWSALEQDLAALASGGELVSLTAVTDPFADCQQVELQRAFHDLARPFKQHFVVDLSQPMSRIVCPHHRRNAQQALKQLTVEQCAPGTVLAEWQLLYDQLIRRHLIAGPAAFSRASFARQLEVPGMSVFRVRQQDETLGMTLWYRCGERAYYHLAAYAPRGYALKASFALFWKIFEQFADEGVRWLALGAGAGLDDSGEDGLTRFKRGWATGTRTAYLCGRIFDRTAYAALTQAARAVNETYFPAYRRPPSPTIVRGQTA